jgi:manganese/zinc/iron transport system permease protein
MLEALTFSAGYTATVVSLGVIALGAAGGLLGTFILLRGRALAADAISHAALPGFAGASLVAALMGSEGKSTLILGTGAVIASVIALRLVGVFERVPRLKADAAIGIVLSGAYALGLVLLSIVQALPSGGQAGLTSYLLGSTAGMLSSEALTNAAIGLGIAAVLAALFKEFAAVVFDPAAARVMGLPAGALDNVMLILLLMLAIAALRSVGAILFVALVVIPPAAARLWTERLRAMALLALAIGAAGAHLGVALSAALPRVPTGPAIVLTYAAVFALSLLIAPRRGLIARASAAWEARATLRARLDAERARP